MGAIAVYLSAAAATRAVLLWACRLLAAAVYPAVLAFRIAVRVPVLIALWPLVWLLGLDGTRCTDWRWLRSEVCRAAFSAWQHAVALVLIGCVAGVVLGMAWVRVLQLQWPRQPKQLLTNRRAYLSRDTTRSKRLPKQE